MNYLKSSHEAVAAEALTSLGGFTPPAVLALAHGWRARHPRGAITPSRRTCLVPSSHSSSSAVRCSRCSLCAARGQVRLGVAIFSYNGQVNFGVTGDYDTTPDIDVFCHGLEDTMTAMVKVATASKA